jgi:hypothetical protein
MFEWAETVGQQMMTAQKKKRLKYFIATDNDDVRTLGCSPPSAPVLSALSLYSFAARGAEEGIAASPPCGSALASDLRHPVCWRS